MSTQMDREQGDYLHLPKDRKGRSPMKMDRQSREMTDAYAQPEQGDDQSNTHM